MACAGVPSTAFSSVCVTNSHPFIFLRSYYLKHTPSRSNFPSLSATHAGATINDFFSNGDILQERKNGMLLSTKPCSKEASRSPLSSKR
ncbi:protein PEP-RELATED DEVELOPMENT ARRESTED 1, chloroplastic [Salvia divinorum]|uniref:Protein PEP-RELATED DEVELOPMENT ARRESTED 1, chloroplastic n=1 Tax=Salvia divinorum TaxID=28513 RepID=A0ABD1IFC6_SALDI